MLLIAELVESSSFTVIVQKQLVGTLLDTGDDVLWADVTVHELSMLVQELQVGEQLLPNEEDGLQGEATATEAL